ncbi:MAG: thiamine ABC transporter ATP-binding protein [Phyllobacteriaceae bacterium]|nr:thiamine ABC transporter ATP-binding protein [Phyllobacteriaceae bacterium]MBA92201.1 thiamine ABC transporter ATP-binding protein [Phyllobacteriaceae bacterium]
MSGGLEVELRDVRLSLDGFEACFDARLEAGSITALVGASGSGKSTFLNLIAGFDRPGSGRVLIGGVDMTERDPANRPVSMVFQENNLFGHLDIAANVGLGRSPSLRLSATDRADIAQALERTGLAGKERRKPAELSGGERQRAALARVLVRDRPVLLLDEPFASLGPALRTGMLDLLTALQRETGMTLVMVTHHPEDAVALGGQALFLEDGRVAASGRASNLFGPQGPEAVRRYTGRT